MLTLISTVQYVEMGTVYTKSVQDQSIFMYPFKVFSFSSFLFYVYTGDDDGPKVEELLRRKKRIVEAPKANGYYHCQYYLLPDDEEPTKTDVVTFGMAAKIYTESESKVLKTWQEGDQTWIAWSHR